MRKIIPFIVILFFLLSFNQIITSIDNDGGVIYSADNVTGLIDPKADIDTFTFTASKGQTIIVRASRETGDINPEISLYSPNGSKEASAAASDIRNYGTTSISDHVIQNTGDYQLAIRDSGSNEIGNYSLSLIIIQDATTSSTDSDGGQISTDQTATGEINFMPDMDAFIFSASSGQSFTITISRESGGVNPAIYLYSPNGSKEASAAASDIRNYGTTSISDHVIQNTGQYELIVMDSGANDIGEYSFSYMLFGSGSPQDSSDTFQDDNIDDKDDDNDGYTDYIEELLGTKPDDKNSKPDDNDLDGFPDLIDDDDDNDGYTDSEENDAGTDPFDKSDYPVDVEKRDSDNDGSNDNVDDDDDDDGFTDVQEFLEGTDPLDSNDFPSNVEKLDSDFDGISDSLDTDDDDDGMPDHWELFYGFNPLSSTDATYDADVDSYSNLKEFNGGSNPRDKDDYPDKGLSSLDILLIVLSLIGGAFTIYRISLLFTKNPVLVYKKKIEKTTTLKELKTLWLKDVKPQIEKKNFKEKQAKKIKQYVLDQKRLLTDKQKKKSSNKDIN